MDPAKIISTWSFKKRLFLIIFASAIFIFTTIAATVVLISRFDGYTQHVSSIELAVLNETAHQFREISDIHSQLFHLLHHANKNGKKKDMSLMGSVLMDKLDHLLKTIKQLEDESIERLQTGHLNNSHHDHEIHISTLKLASHIHSELLKYRNTLASSIEMLTVDSRQSLQHLSNATNSFNQINNLFAEIILNSSSNIKYGLQKKIDNITTVYWPMVLIIVAMGIIGILVLARLTYVLSNQYGLVQSSLDRLGEGDTGVVLPRFHVNNEMSRVMQSLEKFKQTLLALKQSEIDLREKNTQLELTEKSLEQSLYELTKAKEDVEQASHAKTMFLANVGHELRTPLNAILGMAQLLQQEKLTEEQHDHVNTVYHSGRNLLDLLNNLLDFSKLEAGKQQLDFTPFKLDLFIEEIRALFTANIRSKGLKFIIEISPDVPAQLYGDAMRIRQIMVNLINNAIKFTEKGSITVRVKTADKASLCSAVLPNECPYIGKDPAVRCDWNTLQFEVTDTGIGISDDQQVKVFGLFNQADSSTTRKYGGTGLGLSIVKQLVELMDGEIGLQSQPGRGSTFWFRLCLPPDAAIASHRNSLNNDHGLQA
ncbi:MAG: ATP-binding protein [Gammaproteobacteria bacterium]|nr:ATP-binding protein [Gammaproteobacteria bacterium]